MSRMLHYWLCFLFYTVSLSAAEISDSGFPVEQKPSGGSINTNNVDGSFDDFLMDLILTELRDYLKNNGDTVLAIPPVSQNFTYDVLGISMGGWFNTSSGSFRNPATVQRSGDVDVRRSTGRLVASMSVTFTELKVNFPDYTASIIGISEQGAIDVTIQNNAVFIEISVYYIPHCVVSLSRFEVSKMSGILVDMTGLGVFNPLEGQIIAWILESYRTAFTTIVENVVRNKIQEELAKTKICKFKKPY